MDGGESRPVSHGKRLVRGRCVASLALLGDILELVMQEFVVSQTCVMLRVTALVIFLWFRVGHTPLVAVLCRHLRISSGRVTISLGEAG